MQIGKVTEDSGHFSLYRMTVTYPWLWNSVIAMTTGITDFNVTLHKIKLKTSEQEMLTLTATISLHLMEYI